MASSLEMLNASLVPASPGVPVSGNGEADLDLDPVDRATLSFSAAYETNGVKNSP